MDVEDDSTRLITMCLRNLSKRRTRTSLCIAGIAFAVLFVVTVAGVTSKYVAVIKEMNVFFSGDVVVVAKGSMVINALPLGASLLENTAEELTTIPEVASATPILFILGGPTDQEGALQLVPSNITIGVPAGNWSVLVGSTPLKAGGIWPSTNAAQQIVIGPSLADQYNLTVGSSVKIKNSDLHVVGILGARSSLMDRSIIMPLRIAQDIYGYNMLVSMIVASPQPGAQVEAVAEKIETEIPETSALTDAERGETVEPIINEVALWNLGIRGMLYFMSIVLVSTVAMINVSEKRRDFATLHAIGAPATSVFRMVITETALLGFIGGVIGTFLGVLATVLMVNFYTGIPIALISGEAFVLVPVSLMLETLGSAVLTSSLASIIPAIAAARTSIAEVLRAEY